MLEDIAILTGGHVISDDMGRKLQSATLDDLGTAHQIRITKDNTTIVGGAGDKDAIKPRVEQIRDSTRRLFPSLIKINSRNVWLR